MSLHAADTRHGYIRRLVTQWRGFPRRFNTADGGSLSQGHLLVRAKRELQTCRHITATAMLPVATAGLPFAFAVDLAVRGCTIFVATSGCRNTKLGTSQISVHLPHLRSQNSAVGTVTRLRAV